MQEVVGTAYKLWGEMMTRLIIACCIFSFILGSYSVVLINKHRETKKTCQVKFGRGEITTVHVGVWE
jgi:hypothetical protein